MLECRVLFFIGEIRNILHGYYVRLSMLYEFSKLIQWTSVVGFFLIKKIVTLISIHSGKWLTWGTSD